MSIMLTKQKKSVIKNIKSGKTRCFDTELQFEVQNRGFLWNSWQKKTITLLDCTNDPNQELPLYECKYGVCRNMKTVSQKQVTPIHYRRRDTNWNESDDLRLFITGPSDRH